MASIIHTFKKVVEESAVVPLPHFSRKGCTMFQIGVCESITAIHLHNGWYEVSHAAPGARSYDSLKQVALNADPCPIEQFNEVLQIVKDSLQKYNPKPSNQDNAL